MKKLTRAVNVASAAVVLISIAMIVATAVQMRRVPEKKKKNAPATLLGVVGPRQDLKNVR